MAKSSNTP
ncbi:hypothetical protein Bhyg_00896 [Pseudolycoriella hygida]|uniref:Uncharacterized protein n=1 Tax=Pseudolycoriella hygida TaxID=35572 RepID=A0A9Q0N8V1_9DIPT|nr:hypothetical protein Bhyg_00896 [Pseudolycoriella hygida]